MPPFAVQMKPKGYLPRLLDPNLPRERSQYGTIWPTMRLQSQMRLVWKRSKCNADTYDRIVQRQGEASAIGAWPTTPYHVGQGPSDDFTIDLMSHRGRYASTFRLNAQGPCALREASWPM